MSKKHHLSEEQITTLIKEFQPIIYQPKHDKYEPKFMYYRTRIRGNILQVTYYTVWDNERHPRYVFHVLYAFLFRKFYYGSIKDIEFIQIDIDLLTKQITDIRYDQPNKNNYNVMFPFHRPNHLKRLPLPNSLPNKEDYVFVKFHGKENRYHGLIRPRFTNQRVHMAVASWNHVYDLYIKDLDDKAKQFSGLLLQKFDYKTYKKYKTNRRSKGQF